MSSDPTKKKLIHELKESFKVIDSCLRSYYDGGPHMYRPLAGQLRILFCDTTNRRDNSLLGRAFKNFRLTALEEIELYDADSAEAKKYVLDGLAMACPAGHKYVVAKMPFQITEFANRLQIADVEPAQPPVLLPLSEWVQQKITVHPAELSVRQVIRSVADKGGGSHVDTEDGCELSAMKSHGPTQLGMHVLFIIALARLAQALGIDLRQRLAKLGDAALEAAQIPKSSYFDPDDESVKQMAQVPEHLLRQRHSVYSCVVVKRVD